MKSIKSISEKIKEGVSYIYFSFLALLLFSEHLNATGTVWTELLMLAIASAFIIQLKYKFKHVDAIFGMLTLLWSLGMVLAVYSDAIKVEHWTWTMNRFLIVAFLIMNFICSMSLCLRSMISPVKPQSS